MSTVWHKILELDELAEGRVKTVVAGHRSLAVSRFEGAYGALDNRCPLQGRPLGEGAIEYLLDFTPLKVVDFQVHVGASAQV